MLNQFRTTNIVWDKASLKLYAAIRASSSDENGRKLVVQVINKGVTENLENTSLSLYWEQGETKGLDAFNLIDAKNGIFEIYYTTEMLSHIGQLKAYLYLIDAVGAVTSEPFGLTVFKGIDTDAIQSDNSISTLAQAIIDVNNLKSDIAVIKSEEEIRKSNEISRVQAEHLRASQETKRVSNETNRVDAEDTRNTNETNRVDAETSRVTAESARVTAESARVTAFEEIADLTSLIDITGDFTLSEGVESFTAYKLGRLRFIRFDYKPTETGFTQNVITTTKHKPLANTSVTVSTSQKASDSSKGITSCLLSSGIIIVVTPEVPSNPMLFTCMYLT